MIKIVIKNKANLMEMPIVGIKKIGDFSKPNTPSSSQQGFEASDLKFLNNEKAIEKIRTVWLKSKHNLNLIFLSAQGSHFLGLSGNQKQFSKGIKEWIKSVIDTKQEASRKAINLVILGNWGDDKVPLTGWIIAHKLGHALMAELEFNGDSPMRFNKEETAMDAKVRVEFTKRTRATDFFSLNWAISSIILQGGRMADLGTFKSARELKVSRAEAWKEFIAQYIITGSVKLSRENAIRVLLAEQDKNKSMIEFFKQKDRNELSKYLEELLVILEDVINTIFAKILQEAVGQVYFD